MRHVQGMTFTVVEEHELPGLVARRARGSAKSD